MGDSLFEHSIELILSSQAASGAYPACVNFPTYQYAWFRDGSFCAHAMLRTGHADSAARFHDWASATLLANAAKIDACLALLAAGQTPAEGQFLHSRFTLSGAEVPGHWGHHQPDGLGAWLWALSAYCAAHPAQPLPANWRSAAELAVRYLSAIWRRPCSDCWEEHEDMRHTYSLAAVYGGLHSAATLLGDFAAAETAAQVRAEILSGFTRNGRFVKSDGLPAVDANLLGLYLPFGVVAWDDPLFQATLAAIRTELTRPLGLHRYSADSYYGGGQWVLLTAWLGWAYAEAGLPQESRPLLEWVRAQAAPNGDLPEQVPAALNFPQEYAPWVQRWGPIASPLLWSHAQYILLTDALRLADPLP